MEKLTSELEDLASRITQAFSDLQTYDHMIK